MAAEIRLMRQVWKGAVLLVEGATDAKVFDQFVDSSACQIEVGYGKQNVCDAVDLLEDEGVPGIVGVIDADFDHLTGVTYGLDNLCVTDVHDLDLMIFLSPSLDRYIAEYGDRSRIEKQFGDVAAIRTRIIEVCLPLGSCRLVSQRRGLRLRFNGIKHDDLVDNDTLELDQAAMVTTLIARSSASCTATHLRTYIESEMARNHDPCQLAVGHDVAAVLGIALRKTLADRRDVHTWASEIEAGLRLAFDWNAMTTTALFRCLQAWEANNRPFRLFR